MSKSPLNHNPFGSIGKQTRTSNNSQANKFQGALGKLKSLTQNNVPQDPLDILPNNNSNILNQNLNQGINVGSAISTSAQQAQVAQGTEGPSTSSTTQAVNAGDYSPMGINQAFLMKSPLKEIKQKNINYEK